MQLKKITSSKSTENSDGTVTVDYFYEDGRDAGTCTYSTRRQASIESLLVLFPGTNRKWLEEMHR